MSSNNDLRAIKRFITTVDLDGRSVFSKSSDEEPPKMVTPLPMNLSFCYATQNFPVDIHEEKDIEKYNEFVKSPPAITIPNGTTARVVDFPPNYTSAMHRTISVNYNFVIEGEIEIILDSGQTRMMKQGDVLVQRSINHAWRNPSEDRWARLAAVTLPASNTGLEEAGMEGLSK